MEKVGIAVVGALILIILVVGWAHRNSGAEERKPSDSRVAEVGTGLRLNAGDGEGGEEMDPAGAGGMTPTDPGRDTEPPAGEGGGVEIDLDDPKGDPKPDPKPGVEPAPAPAPTPAAKRTHTVAANETLSGIAQELLGGARYWSLIAEANPGVDPNALRLGTVLTIPERPAKGTEPAPGPATPGGKRSATPATATGPRPAFIPEGYLERYAQGGAAKGEKTVSLVGKNQYRVAKGDTLGGIAQKTLGSARHANKIFEANRDLMKKPDDLQVGWVLEIPAID